ncbi:MAG: hypothetical protein HY567_02235 [Candidatus Kerfeldbacteria bacterium]|nr:hypothetical protein [Candidatus Kerfeldbacteria bacterium]
MRYHWVALIMILVLGWTPLAPLAFAIDGSGPIDRFRIDACNPNEVVPTPDECAAGVEPVPAPPINIIDPCDPNDPKPACNHYSWSGEKWRQTVAQAGIPYVIDISTLPTGIDAATFKTMVDAAAAQWDAISAVHFVRDPNRVLNGEAGVCNGCGWIYNDGINSISFRPLAQEGLTNIECWRDAEGDCIVEKDKAPNDTNRNIEPTREDDTAIDITPSLPWTNGAAAGKYDLQSTITHELGHWLSLDDLVGDGERMLTMYHEPLENSIEHRSLGTGDVRGARIIYDGGQ